jgi:hypothetical protein
MLRILLFETKIGEWLLRQFEKNTNLAVVPVNWLDDQAISPAEAVESDTEIDQAPEDVFASAVKP